jgi:hypothetical protein
LPLLRSFSATAADALLCTTSFVKNTVANQHADETNHTWPYRRFANRKSTVDQKPYDRINKEHVIYRNTKLEPQVEFSDANWYPVLEQNDPVSGDACRI